MPLVVVHAGSRSVEEAWISGRMPSLRSCGQSLVVFAFSSFSSLHSRADRVPRCHFHDTSSRCFVFLVPLALRLVFASRVKDAYSKNWDIRPQLLMAYTTLIKAT